MNHPKPPLYHTLRKKSIALLLLPLLFFAFTPVFAAASENTLESVKSNCVAIKTSLHSLQAANALARVNLGQNYEDILEKLMTNMNSRFVSNQKNAGNLLNIAAEFNENLGYFRKNYVAYDQQLENLVGMDCQKYPQTFYAELEKARALRSEVRFNYTFLGSLIDKYRAELKRIEKEL